MALKHQGLSVDNQQFTNEYCFFIEFDSQYKFLRVKGMVDSGAFALFILS
jgi:hypothetical protein